jgi:shikimate kinase
VNSSTNIFLVGLMGAGKTTVGRLLARELGWPFYDSDHEIEHRTGTTVPTIFEMEGEEGFRRREMQAIDELTALSQIVLATGGGAVLRAENRQNLAGRGIVVYLKAAPEELWQRTRRDKNRPLLQIADPKKKLEQLFAERDSLYREVADIVVETGKPNVTKLVATLLEQLRAHSKFIHEPHSD